MAQLLFQLIQEDFYHHPKKFCSTLLSHKIQAFSSSPMQPLSFFFF